MKAERDGHMRKLNEALLKRVSLIDSFAQARHQVPHCTQVTTLAQGCAEAACDSGRCDLRGALPRRQHKRHQASRWERSRPTSVSEDRIRGCERGAEEPEE